MDEAASRLRMSRRALQDLVRDYGHYFLNGNRKLFRDSDIEKLDKIWRSTHPKHPPLEFQLPRHIGKQRPQSVVYILRCGDYIKIGYSLNFVRRLEALRSTSPHDVLVIATMGGGKSLELQLHKQFAAYRHHHEWFRNEGELAEYVKGLLPK
jgi:hypothetical protein